MRTGRALAHHNDPAASPSILIARIAAVIIGIGLVSFAGVAQAAPDADDIARCAEQALKPGAMVQDQHVVVQSEDGWRRESERTMYWRRGIDGAVDILFDVTRPLSEAGLRVLINQAPIGDPVVHVYSPATGRPRRLVGNGASNSVLGSDLTFAEARHLQRFLLDEASVRVADADLNGTTMMVIETRPEADDSDYGLIRSFVDLEFCIPLKVEFFGRNGTLSKSLIAPRDQVATIGAINVPRQTQVIDHLHGSFSEFTVTRIDTSTVLDDRMFTLAAIKKGH